MTSAAEQFASNLSFANFAKAEELKKRLLFTLGALIVYRLGTFIPIPGINPEAFAQAFQSQTGGLLGTLNLFAGGAVERMAIFALNIMPYISASIIMQLMTSVIPSLEAIKKEGEQGRRLNERPDAPPLHELALGHGVADVDAGCTVDEDHADGHEHHGEEAGRPVAQLLDGAVVEYRVGLHCVEVDGDDAQGHHGAKAQAQSGTIVRRVLAIAEALATQHHGLDPGFKECVAAHHEQQGRDARPGVDGEGRQFHEDGEHAAKEPEHQGQEHAGILEVVLVALEQIPEGRDGRADGHGRS